MGKVVIGKVRPVYRGEYSGTVTYESMDFVRYLDDAWIAIADGVLGVIPGTDPTKWVLLGGKGAQGPKGDTGIKGDKGVKGDTGQAPEHSWAGPSLRFQTPDGSWGPWTNLQGPAGADGPQGPQGLQGPKGDKGDTPTLNAAAILAEVLKVDGTGSGLDADLLDGFHANTGTTVNTIPVRNAQGDIPGNITGNAATATSATSATTATNAGHATSAGHATNAGTADVANKLSTSNGGAPCYAVRAWGRATFNETSATLYSSGNIATIVVGANKSVSVTFTTALSANYFTAVCTGETGVNGTLPFVSTVTTAGATFIAKTPSGTIEYLKSLYFCVIG